MDKNVKPKRARRTASPESVEGTFTAEGAARESHTGAPPANTNTASDREQRIAEAAYYRAERRGFAPGSEMEDWLAAEAEID